MILTSILLSKLIIQQLYHLQLCLESFHTSIGLWLIGNTLSMLCVTSIFVLTKLQLFAMYQASLAWIEMVIKRLSFPENMWHPPHPLQQESSFKRKMDSLLNQDCCAPRKLFASHSAGLFTVNHQIVVSILVLPSSPSPGL